MIAPTVQNEPSLAFGQGRVCPLTAGDPARLLVTQSQGDGIDRFRTYTLDAE